MIIRTCIIPAAGKGSRWAPVSGYLPKEMLPLGDRPVIEWVIKEVESSGCSRIIVIKNKQKKIIETYLSSNKDIQKKVDLIFINQDEPLGIAPAILLAKKLVEDQPFVVALPDLPTLSSKPVTKQLISAFAKQQCHIVSFDKFSSEIAHLYGECLIRPLHEKLLEISHFCPKNQTPKIPHHKNNLVRMSGRFIFTSQIFPIIEKLLGERAEAEISDRTALREAQNSQQKVLGLRISGHTYDTGYPEGYVRANTAFFKKFARRKVGKI